MLGQQQRRWWGHMPALSLSPGKSIRSCTKRDTDPRTDRPCDLMGILVIPSVFCTLKVTESLHDASVQSIWFCWKKELKIGSRNERKSPHGLMGERDGKRGSPKKAGVAAIGNCLKKIQNILGGILGGFLPFSSRLSMSSRAERRGVEERSRQRK